MHLHLQKTNFVLVILVLFSSAIFAQETIQPSKKYPKNSKVLYRTIEVKEDIGKIVVAIDEHQDFQYDYWQGDAILVEQEIHLENAPNSVFNELMRKKRYTISESFEADALVLQYRGKSTKDLQVNYKDVNEKVYLKLLVPEKIGVVLQQ